MLWVLLLFWVGPLWAAEVWVSVGPPGRPAVAHVVIDPSDASRWAVLTEAGAVWLTDDAGTRWRRLGRGLDRRDQVADRLADLADAGSEDLVDELQERVADLLGAVWDEAADDDAFVEERPSSVRFVEGVVVTTTQPPPDGPLEARRGDLVLVGTPHGLRRRHAFDPVGNSWVPGLLACLDGARRPTRPRGWRGAPRLSVSLVASRPLGGSLVGGASASSRTLRGATAAAIGLSWGARVPGGHVPEVGIVQGLPVFEGVWANPAARAVERRAQQRLGRRRDEVLALVATRQRILDAPAVGLGAVLARALRLAENRSRLARLTGAACAALPASVLEVSP